jgi:hypothetical protein
MPGRKKGYRKKDKQPARKFSTDDEGGNAEDVNNIGTINRYSSDE